MGPRLIMNICLIFPGPVFSQCKVANSELLLHNHLCAQLSYCFETSSRQVFHCGGKQCSIKETCSYCHSNVRAGTSYPTLDRLVILTAEHVYSGRPGDRSRVHGLLRSEIGSTLYYEGSFVRRFFSPKPFEVAMVRRTYGPKVLYSEVPVLRK